MLGSLLRGRKVQAAATLKVPATAAPETAPPSGDGGQGKAAPTQESPESHPIFVASKFLATFFAILAIPLYVAGATYRSSYYKGFAVPIEDMDFSIYETLLDGAKVMLLPVASLFMAISAIIFITALLNHQKVGELLKMHWGWGISTIIVVFLLFGSIMFYLGNMLGTQHSRRDMQEDKTTLPDVTLELTMTEQSEQERDEEEREIDGKPYRLVAHVNGHYYIFSALKTPKQVVTPRVSKDYNLKPPEELDMSVKMFVIPDSRVRHVRVLRFVSFSPESIVARGSIGARVGK